MTDKQKLVKRLEAKQIEIKQKMDECLIPPLTEEKIRHRNILSQNLFVTKRKLKNLEESRPLLGYGLDHGIVVRPQRR